MTIRLACPECKRKLKVPDEALGKKILCPSCGARFRGRIEPGPLPTTPQVGAAAPSTPQLSQMMPTAVEPMAATALADTLLVDYLFAEMAHSPIEGSAAPKALQSPVPKLELDEPPIEIISEVSEMVDPIVNEDGATSMDVSEGVEAEAAKANASARGKKVRKEGKQSRRGLFVVYLIGGLAVALLVFGGAGYMVYRTMKTGISEDDWKVFMVPNSQCTILIPGTPDWTPTGDSKIQMYRLVRPKEQLSFFVQYKELEPGASPKVDEIVQEEIDKRKRDVGGTEESRKAIQVGMARGYEFQVRESNGDLSMTRLFLISESTGQRVYQATVSGSNIQPGPGDATKFLNSLFINVLPAGAVPEGITGMPPPPGGIPGKR